MVLLLFDFENDTAAVGLAVGLVVGIGVVVFRTGRMLFCGYGLLHLQRHKGNSKIEENEDAFIDDVDDE